MRNDIWLTDTLVGKEEFGLRIPSQASKFFQCRPLIRREAQAAETSHPKGLELIGNMIRLKNEYFIT